METDTRYSRSARMQSQFEGFRAELDDYNDRRERLIKASRDVTTASKRLIFLLHRFPHTCFPAQRCLSSEEFQSASPDKDAAAARKLLAEAYAKRAEIVAAIIDTAQKEQLADDAAEPGRAMRYDRAYGSGLEEFTEAVTFLYYLEHGSIMSLDSLQALFGNVLPITPQRFLLGLSDLTGELMRFATNAIGAGDTGIVVIPVLDTLRTLMHDLDPFVPLIRDFRKKQQVTAQSTRKIEDISYAIKVRSAEFGSDPAAVREMLKRALASGTMSSHDDDGGVDG